MAGQLQPDVLIVDILLPGIDGATLITSLRSHPQFAHSRLIVITSLDEPQRAALRLRAGRRAGGAQAAPGHGRCPRCWPRRWARRDRAAGA